MTGYPTTVSRSGSDELQDRPTSPAQGMAGQLALLVAEAKKTNLLLESILHSVEQVRVKVLLISYQILEDKENVEEKENSETH